MILRHESIPAPEAAKWACRRTLPHPTTDAGSTLVPHEATFFQLPCGARICRLELSGAVSGEEARMLLAQLQPGAALHGTPLLIVLQRLDSFSSDARGAVGQVGLEEVENWEAVVVTNPVIRVTVNFIMRIQGRKKTKLFSSEPEALQWLDARVREDMAAKPGTFA
jgi:hypothetical protein